VPAGRGRFLLILAEMINNEIILNSVNKTLSDIVGLPLARTTRTVDMECIKFGTLLKPLINKDIVNVGLYGIHLQCPWRITDSNGIIVANNDLYEPVNEDAEYDEDFDWDIIMGNLRDVKMESVISKNELYVMSAQADIFGGLEILFENSMKLSVFPNATRKSEYTEFWRLLDNRNEKSKHLVSLSTGFNFEE
jgi:hypothetical protein